MGNRGFSYGFIVSAGNDTDLGTEQHLFIDVEPSKLYGFIFLVAKLHGKTRGISRFPATATSSPHVAGSGALRARRWWCTRTTACLVPVWDRLTFQQTPLALPPPGGKAKSSQQAR